MPCCAVQAAIARREPFTLRVAPLSGSRKGAALQLLFRPATGDHLSEHAPLIGIPGLVDGLVKEGEEGGQAAAHHYFAVVQVSRSVSGGFQWAGEVL